jgi:Domain of unknown function (DUF4304)
MEKKELVNIINNVLMPIGFKRKGNYWVVNGDIITKMVNLQKSQFSNSFYINYGYILKSIPLTEMMHIYNRVGSTEKAEQQRITELLDFENSISDLERTRELNEILHSKLVAKIQMINTEEKLFNELKNRLHLNDISLVVKKYFNLA